MSDLRKMLKNPPSLPPPKIPSSAEEGGEKWVTFEINFKILLPYPLEKISYSAGEDGKKMSDFWKISEKILYPYPTPFENFSSCAGKKSFRLYPPSTKFLLLQEKG